MKAFLLANPTLYHYLRQVLTGGMPFDRWLGLYGFDDPRERIGDLGCGPADILRYLSGKPVPDFYLGVDVSDRYLNAAAARADRLGLRAEFVRMDLDRLPYDGSLQARLKETLESRRITRVLLLGVLHHITDDAARATLDLAHDVPSIKSLVTSDVVYMEDRQLNNRLCDWDRGEFVRDEAAYAAIARSSSWPAYATSFTAPRFSFIRYIHYTFSKEMSLDRDNVEVEEVSHNL